jgi:O-antigen/teichoic acid export membrane protein
VCCRLDDIGPDGEQAVPEKKAIFQMSLVKRVASGILWAQASKVLEMALSFVLSIVVVRRLGPRDYGAYGLTLAVLNFGALLSDLGLRDVLGKYLPPLSSERGTDGEAALLRTALGWRILATALVVVLLFVFRSFVSTQFSFPDFYLYFVPLAMLLFGRQLLQVLLDFLNARLNMKSIALVNLSTQAAMLGLTLFLFWQLGVSVDLVLYASAATTWAGLVCCVWLLRKWLAHSQGIALPRAAMARFGLTIWAISWATFGLASQVDVLLLGYLLKDTAQIGYYNVAVMSIARVHGLLFAAWGGMTLPVLSEAHHSNGLGGLARAWTSYIKLLTILVVPVFVFLIGYARSFIPLLYSDAYLNSVALLQIFTVSNIVSTVLGHGLGTVTLYVIGKEGVALRFRLVCGAINVLLDIVLISLFGVLGAILATGTASILVVFLEFLFVRKYVGVRYPLGFLAKICLAALVSVGPAILIARPDMLSITIAGTAYGLLFLGLLYLLKPLSPQDKLTLHNINPRLAKVLSRFQAPPD